MSCILLLLSFAFANNTKGIDKNLQNYLNQSSKVEIVKQQDAISELTQKQFLLEKDVRKLNDQLGQTKNKINSLMIRKLLQKKTDELKTVKYELNFLKKSIK